MAASSKQAAITHEQIIRDVRAGQVAPIYYLMGEEAYYIDRLSDFLVDTLLKPEERDFNLDLVYGADVTADQIVELARTYPMMADRRIVLVREAQSIRSLDALDAYLHHLTSTTVLIMCHKHGVLDRRKAVAKTIQEVGVLYESKRVFDGSLPSFITNYLRKKQVGIVPEAVQMLADHVGTDLCRMASELDKLVLALPSGEKNVSQGLVEELTGMSKDFNNFELQSALARKDIFRANQIVKYFQGNPRSFALPATLSNLFTFFSNIMLTYYSPDKTENGIAGWLGISPWKVRKDIMPAVRNYTGMKVMRILSEIRKTDAASKGVGGCKTSPGELLQELVFIILH
ncbi:MAG: DNA polymerase III subunit delta [Bacteroidaceae bacterium]|nr:DNA polymerase III subunit delta [Bacteroidaceae bacterium]